MPFRTRAIDDGRVVLVVATGPAERDDWLDLLGTLGRPGGLLIDLRRRVELPPASAATMVGRDLARNAPTLGPVALVARPGAQYGLTRIVDALASQGGVTIRSFQDLRAGYDWLRRVTTLE